MSEWRDEALVRATSPEEEAVRIGTNPAGLGRGSDGYLDG